MRLVAVMLACALAASATAARAAEERPRDCKNHYILEPPCLVAEPTATVRIAKLYSTIDGIGQAVELEVVGGGPLLLAGKRMTSRDRHGNIRSFTLGEPLFPGVSKLLVRGSAWLPPMTLDTGWGPFADLAMPAGFLAIDGGVLAIEGMDEVAYGPLPVDGWRALSRDGTSVPAYFERWGYLDTVVAVVREFYHAGLDHYFMSSRADEIAMLTSGTIPGWEPTGKALYVASRKMPQPYYVPVCRYLLLRDGGYSHFFSASAAECAALADQPGNILESSAAFYVGAPADGVCATQGTNLWGGIGEIGEPVYRLWNGKPDTNHRFVTDKAERDAMIARGWIPEGEGLDGIAMCAWSVSDPPPLP